MIKPEIRYFDPKKDKISDFKFIFLLSDKVEIFDLEKGKNVEDLDGKCILLRYDENDNKRRTDESYLHAEYLKSAFGKYFEIRIKKKVYDLFAKKKSSIGTKRVVKINDNNSELAFLSELLRLGSIVIFLDLGVHGINEDEDSKHPLTVLFFTEKLSKKQKESLKTLIIQIKMDSYALESVMLDREERVFLKDKYSKKMSIYPNGLVGIDEEKNKILRDIFLFLINPKFILNILNRKSRNRLTRDR